MSSSQWMQVAAVGLIAAFVCVCGCSGPADGPSGTETEPRVATASVEDVTAAKELLDGLAPNATYTIVPDNVMTAIEIQDAASLTPEDIALFSRLTDLETLHILNYRDLDDDMAAQLAELKSLKSLGLTNSVIGDATVEMIVKSFPNLTELDLSSNPNLTNGVLKQICEMEKLERLSVLQNRFSDLGTGRLAQLKALKVLDLRGNMEAGDMTMEILGKMPSLTALKHRSTAVTDFGVEYLAESKTLGSLLMQDFAITDSAGPYLAKIPNLTQLEIFRCQQFGSQGVLALKGMKLTRLKLRDLPMVDDSAMEVFQELPELKRLDLHENESISDYGLENLGALKSLEVLDIWSVPQMSDATVDVIAKLPNLKELSIRSTDISDASIDKLLAMPELTKLTLKDNGNVTPDGLEKLSSKNWEKLDVGN